MYFAPVLFGSIYPFIILVMAASALTICRKDSRKRENVMSIRERKQLAKIELMKQAERQQHQQYSSGQQQRTAEYADSSSGKRSNAKKKNEHSVLLQKFNALCENKRAIKNETNNTNLDEQRTHSTRNINRGSAESSLSTSEPLISRKDLLLMTSKKAKEMAAIMRKREEEISTANRRILQQPDTSQRLHIRSNQERDSIRRSLSERHLLDPRLPQTRTAHKKHSITADAIAADLERQLGRVDVMET